MTSSRVFWAVRSPDGDTLSKRFPERLPRQGRRPCLSTRGLLNAAEELDRFCARWKRELREGLLEVHGMAHTVINGAPLSRAPGKESLPEVAYSLGDEFRDWRDEIETAIALLDQIAGLAPD